MDDADVSRETVQRYDFTPIGNARPTPQGYLKFDANLSRVGVLTYRKKDGSTQRELRPPDEVFDAASLESLQGAPVTDLHSAMVDPSNHCSLARGSVGENIRHDERFIQGVVTIQDKGLIDKINSGERKEGSPGYQCRLDRTPGEFKGERYDAIQRGIRYNHWALGPDNWGRQGAGVALRLDGNDAVSIDSNPSSAGNPPPAGTPKEKEIMRIKLDGIDYELDSETGRQAIVKAIEKRDGDAEASTKKLDELQGKFDAVTKERDDLKKKLDEASDPTRIDGLVNARADLVAKCRPILGEEEKLDGLKTREIHVKTLKKLDDKFDDKDKTDAYVEGVFDQSVKSHVPEERSDGLGAALRSTPSARTDPKPGKGGGTDEIDHYDAGAAQQRMLKRNSEAWKEGLDQN